MNPFGISFLIITAGIVLVMTILSVVIYLLDKTPIAKHMMELWFSYLVYFFVSYLTEGPVPGIVAVSTIWWFWRVRAYRQILEDLSMATIKRKWDLPIMLSGLALSVALYLLGYSFGVFMVPMCVGIAFVGCRQVISSFVVMRERKLNLIYYIFLANVFLVYIHILNYPVLRLVPKYSVFGFAAALFGIFVSAVLLPSLHRMEVARDSAAKLERLVEERTEQLLNQSKFSALGEMAAGVAHEINNPLAVISGKAGQLMRSLKANQVDPEKLIKGLESIESTAFRISRIIKGLKDFSRNAENIPMQPVTLVSIISETLDLCRERFYQSGVALNVGEIPDQLFYCRNIQISQVLLNLLNNSFDAVVLSKEKWVALDIEDHQTKIVIRVRDSGKGIPPEIRNKIMMPFFTTKEVGKGTGIGLSISKGIIEDHLGSFHLDETQPHTCFVIELPKLA